MTEEAFVFSNQGSLNEGRRDLSERDRFVAEVVRARDVVEDETIAIRDDYRLGGLGSELRRKLEGERKKAPARLPRSYRIIKPLPNPLFSSLPTAAQVRWICSTTNPL